MTSSYKNNMEKHIGCMTGFLRIFDRHQILNTERAVDSNSECESPSISRELDMVHAKSVPSPELSSPTPAFYTPVESPVKVLPVINFGGGSTKCSLKFRESPRLSLDSRAIVDAKGSLHAREIRTNTVGIVENDDDESENQRRSPSVVARLMGLDQPPNDCKAELRRSASESRVSRDLRFIDTNHFNQKQFNRIDNARIESNVGSMDQIEAAKPTQRRSSLQQRKSFFDTSDFFPEPKQQSVSIYGEIEMRLRMRGIDEPSRDLETLKQILDALQLKGLLHSNKSFDDQLNSRNFVFERSNHTPFVVTKHSRSPPVRPKRTGVDSPPPSSRPRPIPRRNLNIPGEIDRNAWNSPRGRSSNSPSRSECSVTSSTTTTNSVVRRKTLTVETTRRGNDSVEQQRTSKSPVHSAKVVFRKAAPLDHTQSPRNRKPTIPIRPMNKVHLEDESSSISGSSISWSSQYDKERRKTDKEAKTLLERCDELLYSIAEMTELQPSPVSVLDSSFYKDDSSTAPIMKRTIDCNDEEADLEDEIWSPAISPIQFKTDDSLDDCDYIYISDILGAYNYYPEESDIFLRIEKQQYFKGKDSSKDSTLQRRLIFDTINEILEKNRQLPPWKKTVSITNSSLRQIWSEFRKIREHYKSEDLFEVIFGVLKKDLAGDTINNWGECHLETSEAVLDIERSIFKDLIGETIRDLAVRTRGVSMHRRKLLFSK